MPLPLFGKKKFSSAIQEVQDDLALIDTLLDRLLANNLTATERNRIIAQLSLASSRIGRQVGTIEEMGKRVPGEESGEKTLNQQK
jgi:hypothetical protein